VQRNAKLVQIVLTTRSRGRLAHLLRGRQQQADKQGNDGDDDEQLNEGKSRMSAHKSPVEKE